MAEVSRKKDWCDAEPPKADSGDNFFSNPQLKPYETPIPEGKDWNSSNSTSPEYYSKAQPYGTKGAGYTGG